MTASTLPGVPAAVPTSGPSSLPSSGGASARVTRFRLSVLLGAALFAPAAFLVLRGNLSVMDGLLRFGCALLVGAAGTGLVLATVPSDEGGDEDGDDRGAEPSAKVDGSAHEQSPDRATVETPGVG